jgi:SAM-dependent methyltransferase
MTYQWVDYDPNCIAQRYDRLADIIPFFDWLFFIPAGLRKHAVDRLSLKHGDCVLDVGCGTGRNFPFLREAIGPMGRIYGVDLSAGMLCNARKLRDRHHWTNIHLTEGTATTAGGAAYGLYRSDNGGTKAEPETMSAAQSASAKSRASRATSPRSPRRSTTPWKHQKWPGKKLTA